MNDIWVEREIRGDLIYINGTLSFIACIAAIGYVAKKIWLVGKDYEGNKFWVYLAISFIVSVSGFLFINNLSICFINVDLPEQSIPSKAMIFVLNIAPY